MTVTNTTPPALSGTFKRGNTVHTDNGQWTFDLDYLTYAYQWRRCDGAGANCADITGATSNSYLLQAADVGSTVRSQVTATENSNAPPGATPYFESDWNTVNSSKIGYPPWATIFTYSGPQDVGLFGGPAVTGTANGRVSVVANPYGTGKVCRCEIQDSEPDRPVGSLIQKSELGSTEDKTWDGGAWVNGAEIWVEMELYLPNEFGFASGGSNPFTNIADLHPSSNSGIPAFGLGGYSTTNIQFYAGVPGHKQTKDFIPVNAGNRNRKLLIHLGGVIGTSGGWAEAWLDGVNVVPRFSVQTAEASESGPYWKQGLYKLKDASTPGGKTIFYMGSTRLYTTRPF